MQSIILEAAKGFPVITITGPRQSGKTTLAKMSFPDFEYFNLENPETLQRAQNDPRSLFVNLGQGVIIDEVQRAPELLSWAQVFVDELNLPGKLILTGSNQFEYMKSIGQSLAGRTAVFKLLPFSLEEVPLKPAQNWEFYVAKGFYPRLYDSVIDPQLYYSSYVMTYLERDIRAVFQIRNLREFERFISLCAARTGQLLNVSSLALDCGVDQKTIGAWISILEASFVVYLLKPYHNNLNKRIIKTPKLYFYDVGLAAYLLGIRNAGDLRSHPLRGELFETMVVSDCIKFFLNRGIVPPLHFFRDSRGHEIDLVISRGTEIFPLEIKAGTTINSDYFRNIIYLRKIMGKDIPAGIVFGDRRLTKQQNTDVVGWDSIAGLLDNMSLD
jgi:predicted AAA+ superfamily ATPase